jgi:hypothetical protein
MKTKQSSTKRTSYRYWTAQHNELALAYRAISTNSTGKEAYQRNQLAQQLWEPTKRIVYSAAEQVNWPSHMIGLRSTHINDTVADLLSIWIYKWDTEKGECWNYLVNRAKRCLLDMIEAQSNLVNYSDMSIATYIVSIHNSKLDNLKPYRKSIWLNKQLSNSLSELKTQHLSHVDLSNVPATRPRVKYLADSAAFNRALKTKGLLNPDQYQWDDNAHQYVVEYMYVNLYESEYEIEGDLDLYDNSDHNIWLTHDQVLLTIATENLWDVVLEAVSANIGTISGKYMEAILKFYRDMYVELDDILCLSAAQLHRRLLEKNPAYLVPISYCELTHLYLVELFATE